MIRFVLSLAFSLAVLFSFAQNLVPNPSFEEFTECPFAPGNLHTQVEYWESWNESPDFFHVCSNELDGFAGVPDNAWGSQYPIVGSAYAGLVTYVDLVENGREYIAAELTSALTAGTTYYVMFYASMNDGGAKESSLCATNNLGLRFFEDPDFNAFPPNANPFQPDNFAHLNFDEVLNDSENWTLISGWFTADDAYNWVAIGNFFTDDQTAKLVLNNEDRCAGIYYIENVCVGSAPEECEYLLGVNTPKVESRPRVFPNPTTNAIHFTWPEVFRAYNISICDLQGKEQLILSGVRSGQVLDVSSFQKGIYVVRFSSKDHYSTFKLVLQ